MRILRVLVDGPSLMIGDNMAAIFSPSIASSMVAKVSPHYEGFSITSVSKTNDLFDIL